MVIVNMTQYDPAPNEQPRLIPGRVFQPTPPRPEQEQVQEIRGTLAPPPTITLVKKKKKHKKYKSEASFTLGEIEKREPEVKEKIVLKKEKKEPTGWATKVQEKVTKAIKKGGGEYFTSVGTPSGLGLKVVKIVSPTIGKGMEPQAKKIAGEVANVGSYFIPYVGQARFFGTDIPAFGQRVYKTKGVYVKEHPVESGLMVAGGVVGGLKAFKINVPSPRGVAKEFGIVGKQEKIEKAIYKQAAEIQKKEFLEESRQFIGTKRTAIQSKLMREAPGVKQEVKIIGSAEFAKPKGLMREHKAVGEVESHIFGKAEVKTFFGLRTKEVPFVISDYQKFVGKGVSVGTRNVFISGERVTTLPSARTTIFETPRKIYYKAELGQKQPLDILSFTGTKKIRGVEQVKGGFFEEAYYHETFTPKEVRIETRKAIPEIDIIGEKSKGITKAIKLAGEKPKFIKPAEGIKKTPLWKTFKEEPKIIDVVKRKPQTLTKIEQKPTSFIPSAKVETKLKLKAPERIANIPFQQLVPKIEQESRAIAFRETAWVVPYLGAPQKVGQFPKITLLPTITPTTKVTPKLFQPSAQVPAQKQVPKIVQPQIPQIIQPQIPVQPVTPKPIFRFETPLKPQIPIINFGGGVGEITAIDRKKIKKKARGYKTLIKRRGKWYEVAGVRTRGEAIRTGERTALSTLAASFKIKQFGEVEGIETARRPSQLIFRQYKIKGKQRIQTPDEWIQKAGTRKEGITIKGARLYSIGERKEIRLSRLKAGGKNAKKKINIFQ